MSKITWFPEDIGGFTRVTSSPTAESLPSQPLVSGKVTAEMVSQLNEIRQGLALTGRGDPNQIPDIKVGDDLQTAVETLISAGDLGGFASGIQLAQQWIIGSGGTQADVNKTITKVNQMGIANRGSGGLGGKIFGAIDKIGQTVKENPALLFAAPFAVAAISGALSGAGAGSAFTGSGGGSSVTSAVGGKTAVAKASTLLKNPKALGLTKAGGLGLGGGSAPTVAAGGGGGGFLTKASQWLTDRPIISGAIQSIGQNLTDRANINAQADAQSRLQRERQGLISANYAGTNPGAGFRSVAAPAAPSPNDRFSPSYYDDWEFQYDPKQGRIVRASVGGQ